MDSQNGVYLEIAARNAEVELGPELELVPILPLLMEEANVKEQLERQKHVMLKLVPVGLLITRVRTGTRRACLIECKITLTRPVH